MVIKTNHQRLIYMTTSICKAQEGGVNSATRKLCATLKYFVWFSAALWHVQSLENKEPSQGPSGQCESRVSIYFNYIISLPTGSALLPYGMPLRQN